MAEEKDHNPIIKIPISRKKLLLLTLLSLIFIGLGVWLFLAGRDLYRFTPFLARTTGLLGIIIFGVMAYFQIKRYFEKKAGLEIKEEGIIDNSHNTIMIKWSDIMELKKEEMFGSDFILVMVKNPEAYIKDMDFFQKIFMEWNFKSYGTPLTLSSGSLQCSFDELYNILNRSLLKYHIKNNNN